MPGEHFWCEQCFDMDYSFCLDGNLPSPQIISPDFVERIAGNGCWPGTHVLELLPRLPLHMHLFGKQHLSHLFFLGDVA